MIEGDALDRHAARVRQELELLDYPRRPWMPAPRRPPGARASTTSSSSAPARAAWRRRSGSRASASTNVLVVDENPLDRAGPVAELRAHAHAAHAEVPDRARPRHPQPHAARLVRGAARRGQLGDAGAHPQGDLGGVPGVVPAHARHPGAARHARGRAALERARARPGRCRAPMRARARRRDRHAARAAGRAGDRHRRLGPVGDPGDDPRRAAAAAVRAHARRTSTSRRWRGKRVAVLGAGASAFDNAATALEHGAREVALCFRRPSLVNVNAYRWAEFVGFLHHLGDLPDADKWRFIRQIVRMGQLPPADTLRARARAPRLPPARRLRAGARVEARGDAVAIRTTAHGEADALRGRLRHRRHRLRHRPARCGPSCASVEPHIARWADRYQPPPEASARGRSAAPSLPRARLRVHRDARRARRRTCATSTTTPSAACSAWASAAPASRA